MRIWGYTWKYWSMKRNWRELHSRAILLSTSCATKVRPAVLNSTFWSASAPEESLHRPSPDAHSRSSDADHGEKYPVCGFIDPLFSLRLFTLRPELDQGKELVLYLSTLRGHVLALFRPFKCVFTAPSCWQSGDMCQAWATTSFTLACPIETRSVTSFFLRQHCLSIRAHHVPLSVPESVRANGRSPFAAFGQFSLECWLVGHHKDVGRVHVPSTCLPPRAPGGGVTNRR